MFSRSFSSHLGVKHARFNSTKAELPLLRIVDSNVYQFGSVKPVYKKPLDWTIQAHGEAWAIVGDGKQTLFDVSSSIDVAVLLY